MLMKVEHLPTEEATRRNPKNSRERRRRAGDGGVIGVIHDNMDSWIYKRTAQVFDS